MRATNINFDKCVKRLVEIGVIIVKSNYANELVKHCHGKIGEQAISFGDLQLFADGLYRTLYLA